KMATRKTAPTRSTARSTTSRATSRPASRSRSRTRSAAKQGHVPRWRSIDPARVARMAVLLSGTGCLALLLDIYLGHADPVHTVMLSAFGPLAFLVPVGAGLLVLDSYRRHEGLRPWLRFEESCGAVLLFVAALTLAGLAGVSFSASLVGNSLSDELTRLL